MKVLNDFLKQGSASGILLILAALLAMIAANSPLSGFYQLLIDLPVSVQVGALVVDKPLLLWINDGLMAGFFFLVGLELKREIAEGQLSSVDNIMLPAVAAIGGMAVPAGIYAWICWGNDMAMQGWAIPAATDIAFAMGILALLGSRVPPALKLFLVSLAIIDDIGAIIIIAVFYTENIATVPLIIGAVCLPILFIMNRRNVTSTSAYLLIGAVLWLATLKSGVHATLAGVALAFFIPMRDNKNPEYSPLKELEHNLHSPVSYVVLPVFAFANSGIDLFALNMASLVHPVTLGITLGLFIGKQLGVFGFSWLLIKSGVAKLPSGVNFTQLYGVSILCGVGFTMSLFIGSLAFESTGMNQMFDERLGILAGSILSAIGGYLVLKNNLRKVAD